MFPEYPIRDPQTPSEERFNWLTHGIGLVFSLIGLGALLAQAVPKGPLTVLASLVYGLSLVALFGASTVYHASPHGPWKWTARLLDHCAILLLIAGSYTPFMLLGIGGAMGWTMVLVVWALTVWAIRYKLRSCDPFGNRSVAICLGISWLVVLVWQPLLAAVGPSVITWITVGGAAYMIGIPFYIWRNLPYNHGIWHLFTLAGAGSHYVAVLLVV